MSLRLPVWFPVTFDTARLIQYQEHVQHHFPSEKCSLRKGLKFKEWIIERRSFVRIFYEQILDVKDGAKFFLLEYATPAHDTCTMQYYLIQYIQLHTTEHFTIHYTSHSCFLTLF